MTISESVQSQIVSDAAASEAIAAASVPIHHPPDRAGQFPPIADLAFLSDGEVAALVAPTGNVEWLCLPRIDSPSVFGTLLDRGAGRFRVGPSGMMVPAGQRYVLASMVAETTWMTGTGLLMVRDALLVGPWRAETRMPGQRRPPGDTQAEHVLLRTIKCVHGAVEVIVDCEPMFDYGRVQARWRYEGTGYHAVAAEAEGEALTLRLTTSLRLGIEGGRATARTRLRESERAFVALTWADGVPPATVDDAFASVDATSGRWRQWVGSGRFPDHPWRAHLHRSALTLKALTYAPTGAVAAAPTTSLPRVPRGDRNWDLRYSFVRESAWALRALYALGFRWEADDFLSFLVETTAGDRRLQNFVRVTGEDPPDEVEVAHLRGYGGARPVRVGNAAVRYAQHDVPGALMDAAVVPALARRQLPSAVWGMVRREVEDVVEHWRKPDRGIWALRGEPRHYTTSKVMCWVSLDRGAWLASQRGRPELAGEWREVADAIAADVLAHGVSAGETFKEHYESDALDASLLMIALVGFLPVDDDRVRKTVLAVERELAAGGLVLRRRPRPTEPVVGESVTVCSWWLVAALAMIGELDRARSRAERLLAYASPLGLYAEHLDPASGRQLGNFPHALTHLALIDALLRLIHADASRLPEQRARSL
jgi:GH15 family glucan-1,4-alpha-glucosidase